MFRVNCPCMDLEWGTDRGRRGRRVSFVVGDTRRREGEWFLTLCAFEFTRSKRILDRKVGDTSGLPCTLSFSESSFIFSYDFYRKVERLLTPRGLPFYPEDILRYFNRETLGNLFHRCRQESNRRRRSQPNWRIPETNFWDRPLSSRPKTKLETVTGWPIGTRSVNRRDPESKE